jgi:6-phosphogluconolactonase (cycloisomerase 2 family)
MTNAAAGNAILGFTRAADGSLTAMAAPFATGGKGSGAALGEQGAIVYDAAGERLFAVNAGDDSFSVFPVEATGALGAAVDVPASGVPGGSALVGPKSITVHGNTAYVLFEGNATTASAIAGWTLSGTAATFIAGSIVPLSSTTESVDPAQIEFTPDGDWLVVTEKQSGGAASVAGSGSIDTFAVSAAGVATKKGFYPTASAGVDAGLQQTPYGFAFSGTTLVVSEAGSTGAGTYTYAGGVIAPVAGATQFLPTDPAPCWVAVSADWAYVANAKGPDVSGFTVGAGGGLTSVGSAANAVVARTGNEVVTDAGTTFDGPTDEAVSADGKYLYVLDGALPAIGAFAVNADGTLTRVGAADFTSATLVANVVGLAAR